MSFIELPAGMDPDDLIKKSGAKAFDNILLNRVSLSEMIWKVEFNNSKQFKTAESRAALEKKLEEYCLSIKDNTLKINFRRYFKEMIWQNIIRNKNPNNPTAYKPSKEILATKNYTEIEFIEHAICAFIIKFPAQAYVLAEKITLSDETLNEFKDWIIDLVYTNQDNIGITLEKEVKNSRFYNIYSVLSSSSGLFLSILSNKEDFDQALVFEWMCKKHYLLILKQEYVEVSRNNELTEFKLPSYIKEIQKIARELNEISENFVN
jgi:DNA primase